MSVRRILPLLLALCAVAHADDPQAARRHFDAGYALYDIGKFREAALEYEEAYKAKSDPVLLFNIGQAYRAANEPAKALTAYRSYLRRLPQARNRVEVEGHIARLQHQLDTMHNKQQVLAPESEPAPPPPSTTTPTEVAPTPAVTATPSTTRASTREHTPLYRRWWLWTAVGGAVVVAAVAVGVAFAVPKDAPAPASALTVSF